MSLVLGLVWNLVLVLFYLVLVPVLVLVLASRVLVGLSFSSSCFVSSICFRFQI